MPSPPAPLLEERGAKPIFPLTEGARGRKQQSEAKPTHRGDQGGGNKVKSQHPPLTEGARGRKQHLENFQLMLNFINGSDICEIDETMFAKMSNLIIKSH
jgi:hypothetical protein